MILINSRSGNESWLLYYCRCIGTVLSYFRPVARRGPVGSEEPPSQKGPISCNERSTFKKKVHLLKQKVHCYNYTIQGCRNWPGRLGSCQTKVSPTIKNRLSKQEILLQNNACYCFTKAFALLQIEQLQNHGNRK